MPENLTETGRKYAGIDRSGTASLYREGALREFGGFPESLNNRYNASFLFTPESEAEFKARVSDPLAAIGNELGIGFYLAGRDFRPHCTLLEGEYQGTNLSERQAKFDRIAVSPAIAGLPNLAGKKIEYKYLLVGGNIILTAVDIPDWVLEARAQLTEAYAEEGLKPLSMENILHMTVGRITALPTTNRQERLRGFAQKAQELRHQISGDPLVLEIGAVSTVPPLELLRSRP